MVSLSSAVVERLARAGFVVRRHPGTRRQSLLAAHGVDVVLDVGAARGAYGAELRRFGYTGRIVSFEPLAAAHARLLAASAGDDRWTVRNVALGEEPGTADINVASNSDSSSLLPMAAGHRAAAPHVDYVATESITVARLDDEAPPHLPDGARPFLKLDTQGFEASVLAGGQDTLARCVGLQLELSFVPLYEGGMLIDQAIAMAYDHGFVLAGIEQGFADPGGAILQADGVFVRS